MRYINFIRDYKTSIYVAEAENIIKYLEEQENEEQLWRSIPNKQTLAKHRRGAFATYLLKYRFGKYSSIAHDKIRELDLWIDAKEENDINVKREKLRRLKLEFTEGDYIKEVNRELEQVSLDASAKKFDEELNVAVGLNDYEAIYGIIAHIEGCTTSEEIEAYKNILTVAKKRIDSYETQIKEEYDNATKKDKASLINEFVQRYEGHELAKIARERLYSKDHDLFNFAESTKNIEDYEFYFAEFENCNGIYISDVLSRIKELLYFNELKTQDGFGSYLSLYPRGIMRKEAQDEINKIKRNEEKENRFMEAINGQSIESCTKYLLDFEENDDKKEAIQNKLEDLEMIERDEKAFNQILELEGEEKLKYCKSYLIQFENGLHVNDVRKRIAEVEKELKDNEDFNNARGLDIVSAFEQYKNDNPEGLNLEKADDYITFLNAKATENTNTLQEYMELFPNGLNFLRAEDCVAFLKARDQNQIVNLEEYIQDYLPNGLYIAEAKNIIRQLRLEEEENRAFQIAKESDDIDLFIRYLNGAYPKKSDHELYAKQRIKEIRLMQEDNNDYEETQKHDDEQVLIDYISKYGTKGIHYKEITRRLREMQTGLTDKNLLDKMEDNNLTINYLAVNIEKYNKLIIVLLVIVILLFFAFIGIYIFKK